MRPGNAIVQGQGLPRQRGVARDVSLDLEASSPAAGLLRPPPAASHIAQERVAPARPAAVFILVLVTLACAVTVTALLLGQGAAAVPAERQADGPTGLAGLGLGTGRALAAVAAGLAVVAVGLAGRRMSHSSAAGLLAAALVAADPAFLVQARLAVPNSVVIAALAWALAFVASPIPLLHWLAGLCLAVGVFFQPWAILWVFPLMAFLLLRGHIYAAPQHLGLAFVQVAVLPLVAFGLHALLAGGLGAAPACLTLAPWSMLALLEVVQPGPGLLLLPDPIVWLGGAGALSFLGVGGLAFVMASFRVARAPGRLQVRVVSPMPPVLARGIWLLLLALLAPPVVWLPLFAIALAMGIRELGDDAPGFGVALAVVLLAFAALVLARAWGAVVGLDGGVAEAMELVPWATATSC